MEINKEETPTSANSEADTPPAPFAFSNVRFSASSIPHSLGKQYVRTYRRDYSSGAEQFSSRKRDAVDATVGYVGDRRLHRPGQSNTRFILFRRIKIDLTCSLAARRLPELDSPVITKLHLQAARKNRTCLYLRQSRATSGSTYVGSNTKVKRSESVHYTLGSASAPLPPTPSEQRG